MSERELTLMQAFGVVPPEVARRHRMIPIGRTQRGYVIGVARPDDHAVLESLRSLGVRDFKLRQVSEEFLRHHLEGWYHSSGRLFELVNALAASARGPGEIDPQAAVRYVQHLLEAAEAEGAGDVHLEHGPEGPLVRFRIDGVLAPRPAPPQQLFHRVVGRIKALANLDPGETLEPQDGQFSIDGARGTVDVRLSILPADRGDSVVLRLLQARERFPTLNELGMAPAACELLSRAVAAPCGLIAIAGPTGHGKTTTLHAAIRTIASTRLNVVSIEDPVEVRTPHVRQIPVRRRQGMDFAKALRAVMRQDPDVILVGETRDVETAQLVLQAALAGHLVLTTVHASSVFGIFDRLAQLGVDRGLVADTALVFASQRLLRTVCTWCRGEGCFRCEGSGLRGRQGAFEVLALDGELRRLVAEGASHDRLAACAAEKGFVPLATDGRRLCQEGRTTPLEVRRILGVTPASEPLPEDLDPPKLRVSA